MSAGTLHVVFCRGDARILAEAMEACGRTDAVLCHDDDLSIGPIGPPDYLRRVDWIVEALDFEGWPATPEEPAPSREDRFRSFPWRALPAAEATFWTTTLGHQGRIVLWLTRRSQQNFAGVMEWLRRAGERPCDIVDFTDVLATPSPYNRSPCYALGLADMWPEEFRVLELLGRAERLSEALCREWASRWAQLRKENAPFRAIDGDGLRSAPITVFDDGLLANCRPSWRKVALVVGRSLLDREKRGLHPPSEMVMAARIHALVNAGELEVQGENIFAMRFCEIRLPQPDDAMPERPTFSGPSA